MLSTVHAEIMVVYLDLSHLLVSGSGAAGAPPLDTAFVPGRATLPSRSEEEMTPEIMSDGIARARRSLRRPISIGTRKLTA